MPYSPIIANAVNAWLKEDDWKFSFNQDDGVFTFGLNLKCKLKHCSYTIHIKEKGFTVYAKIDIGAGDQLATVGEYLHRANYGLIHGNFELDPRDGEIRYKCYVPCGTRAPETDVVKDSVYIPAVMIEKYGDPLAAVIFGMQTPEEAIQAAEAD